MLKCQILYFLTFLRVVFVSSVNETGNLQYFTAISELPSKKEINLYLDIYEKLINSLDHVQPDGSLILTLVMSSATLQKALVNRNKLPTEVDRKLNKFLSKTLSTLHNSEKFSVEEFDAGLTDTPYDLFNISILPEWVRKFSSLNETLTAETSDATLRVLNENLNSFSNYTKFILDLDTHHPSPQLSDFCLTSLARNPINKDDRHYRQCDIDRACLGMVLNGDNYGYALTHRFLLLWTAHVSRGCYLFTDEADKAFRKELCAIGYKEAQYIADNLKQGEVQPGIFDLFAEYVQLCALEGHASFLKREFMSLILTYQSPFGCFHDTTTYYTRSGPQGFHHTLKEQVKFFKLKNRKDSWCVRHVTALALGVIATAIRYIVEQF